MGFEEDCFRLFTDYVAECKGSRPPKRIMYPIAVQFKDTIGRSYSSDMVNHIIKFSLIIDADKDGKKMEKAWATHNVTLDNKEDVSENYCSLAMEKYIAKADAFMNKGHKSRIVRDSKNRFSVHEDKAV